MRDGGHAPPARTACPYCGVGCGILATPDGRGGALIAGDPDHPANLGRLCSKGAALGATLDLTGRLLAPQLGGRPASWDAALDAVAQRLADTLARHGPDSIAFYLSGQLLTEDYYVANKLMKGFLGSANVDTNSRLCMASSVAGHRRAFGSDTVPGTYEDWDQADLVTLVGSNAAWCHPVLFQRLVAARQARGTKVVVIDPRRTATCDAADLHLALRSGSDVALWNALLVHLADRGVMDGAYTKTATEGLDAALWRARAEVSPFRDPVAAAASRCGLDPDGVARFFDLFAATPRALTAYSQGVNQSSRGTDKVNAIINVHLATGRIGLPGAGPFSVTGQPNAMGGREVGGLANQLAAHMGFEDPADLERVRRFWQAPRLAMKPGLKAVDMFRAMADGSVRFVWIMGTNPAVSLPDGTMVRTALERCDTVVVSDCMAATDTAACAHVLLPALAWGEKDGTVTNSERRISRQRPFLPPPGEARADWRIVCEVAARLGFGAAFDYAGPAAIFREHAALSAFENAGRRDFDLGGIASITDDAYEALAPVQWPVPSGGSPGGRFFAGGGFFTPSRRGRIVPVSVGAPAERTGAALPFVLNTGRVRDHWHTLTRSAKAPELCRHRPEPFVSIHPADAARAGVADGGLARVTTARGDAVLRARVEDEVPVGMLFAPMHWTREFAARALIPGLMAPAVDRHSGQPELKHAPATIAPFRPRWTGFLLAGAVVPAGDLDGVAAYWARVPGVGCTLYRLAGWPIGEALPEGAIDLVAAADPLRTVLPDAGDGDTIELRARRSVRQALLRQGRLAACLMIAADERLPASDWLASRFAALVEDGERLALLAGAAPGAPACGGPVICACFNVRRDAISDVVRERGLVSAEQVGAALRAGTNCGSCLPEIRAMLRPEVDADAA